MTDRRSIADSLILFIILLSNFLIVMRLRMYNLTNLAFLVERATIEQRGSRLLKIPFQKHIKIKLAG